MVVILMVVIGVLLVVASRFVGRSPRKAAAAAKTSPSLLRRALSGALLIVGGLALLLGVALGSLRIYLAVQTATLPPIAVSAPSGAPSAAPVGGVAAPVEIASNSGAAPSPASSAGSVAGPVAAAHLPPTEISIPRLGATYPVTLSDYDYQLRFRAVGWIVGTAFPGEPGNMVFYGQAEGPYATLDQLGELRPGDDIVIATAGGQRRYRVRSVGQMSEDNVDVVAPTTAAVATLITDVPDNLQQRLVVVADLTP